MSTNTESGPVKIYYAYLETKYFDPNPAGWQAGQYTPFNKALTPNQLQIWALLAEGMSIGSLVHKLQDENPPARFEIGKWGVAPPVIRMSVPRDTPLFTTSPDELRDEVEDGSEVGGGQKLEVLVGAPDVFEDTESADVKNAGNTSASR